MSAETPTYLPATNRHGFLHQHTCGRVKAFNRPPVGAGCGVLDVRCEHDRDGQWEPLYRADSEPSAAPDPWRLAEWHALPEVCLIAGCDNTDIDQRGPVALRDGSIHKACVEHWEGVFRILGEQATREKTDGARSSS